MIFQEGYVTSPTCAPSRAGIMTGRVQNRYGFETQVMEHYPTNWVEYISGRWIVDTGEFVVKAKPSFPAEWQAHKQGVPPTEITLADILKKYGYATGLVGKWHLGVSRKQVPLERGFDYQFGFNGAFSLYTPERNWPHVINHEHQSFSAQHQWNMGRREEAAILENGKVVREEQYLTFAFRDRMKDVHPRAPGRAILSLRRLQRAPRPVPSARRLLLQVRLRGGRQQAGLLLDDLRPRRRDRRGPSDDQGRRNRRPLPSSSS